MNKEVSEAAPLATRFAARAVYRFGRASTFKRKTGSRRSIANFFEIKQAKLAQPD